MIRQPSSMKRALSAAGRIAQKQRARQKSSEADQLNPEGLNPEARPRALHQRHPRRRSFMPRRPRRAGSCPPRAGSIPSRPRIYDLPDARSPRTETQRPASIARQADRNHRAFIARRARRCRRKAGPTDRNTSLRQDIPERAADPTIARVPRSPYRRSVRKPSENHPKTGRHPPEAAGASPERTVDGREGEPKRAGRVQVGLVRSPPSGTSSDIIAKAGLLEERIAACPRQVPPRPAPVFIAAGAHSA